MTSPVNAVKEEVRYVASEHVEPAPYRAPALEKGLDVLECLAEQSGTLTQAQIARALGRSPSELFRTLATLERRGYVSRDTMSGAYALTLRLYELGHTHSPFEHLLRAAERPMRELSASIRESCHLGVMHRGRCLMLAQAEAPSRVRLSIEVGSTIGLEESASGRVLLAYLDEETRQQDLPAADVDTLTHRLALIRVRGYDEARSETTPGVTDVSVPVGRPGSRVMAALTVAALPRDHAEFVTAVVPEMRRCAQEIARTAGLAGYRVDGEAEAENDRRTPFRGL
jgi:DNA-binding IclR family transcriptional regulator